MRRSKNIKLSKAKADKYFAEYIRKRDYHNSCITCGAYGKKDCGHFISRRFESVRFDEKNAHGQCLKCNRYLYGNQFEHGQHIDNLYGVGTAEQLLFKSKQFCKRSAFDYEYLALHYKNKIDEL